MEHHDEAKTHKDRERIKYQRTSCAITYTDTDREFSAAFTLSLTLCLSAASAESERVYGARCELP